MPKKLEKIGCKFFVKVSPLRLIQNLFYCIVAFKISLVLKKKTFKRKTWNFLRKQKNKNLQKGKVTFDERLKQEQFLNTFLFLKKEISLLKKKKIIQKFCFLFFGEGKSQTRTVSGFFFILEIYISLKKMYFHFG